MVSVEKQLIVCGYPKSGNTWLTRLTAELIGCPVKGFWSQPDRKDRAIEGLDRESDYSCFKSHHTFPMLADSFGTFGNGSEKVIYIARAPRDVAISASYFFKRLRGRRILRLLGLNWLHDKITLKVKLTGYCNVVANGGDLPWMNVSWADHVESFLQSKALIVKYENLLVQPVAECKRIIRFLEINRLETDIEEAIYSQSFQKKKSELLKRKKFREADFLKAGKAEQWRNVLSEKQNKIIVSACGDVMKRYGYL